MRVKIFTLSLLLLLSSVATGYAQDATNGNCGENLTWVFSEEDGTLTISGTGAMDDWESVTDRPWASLLNDITAIMVENGVTTIGESAFFECVNLTDVITPLSVTSIGDFAFYGCSKLTSVKLGNGVKSVGMTAFSGCTGLTEIVIPDNVEKIAVAAFGQCTGLTSVTIGKSVVTIEYGGFSGCSNLTTITNLNPTPQNIGGYLNVFGKMESTPGPDLSRVTLYVVSEEAKTAYEAAPVWKDFKEVLCLPAYNGECGENLTWTFSEGTLTISGTGAMDDWDDPKEEAPEALPWLAYLEDITKVVIEEGVTSIGASAFGMCVNLVDVTIPNSVTEIGFAAFGMCSNLEEIAIPNTVDYIGGNAFALCASLTEITIPENVTSIEDGTFVWSGLTAITIPDKVTSIGMFAFGSCADLASVTLGESVEYLGYGAFAECAGLEAITIPDKVEVIDKGAF
ncbi:MAG: leucine-rich repeat domain-containing protein, partial [Prevotellaceae bacterium]|nr:leucine-rich repeat domain-containing protein [Prevotellaceae bacterium]